MRNKIIHNNKAYYWDIMAGVLRVRFGARTRSKLCTVEILEILTHSWTFGLESIVSNTCVSRLYINLKFTMLFYI